MRWLTRKLPPSAAAPLPPPSTPPLSNIRTVVAPAVKQFAQPWSRRSKAALSSSGGKNKKCAP